MNEVVHRLGLGLTRNSLASGVSRRLEASPRWVREPVPWAVVSLLLGLVVLDSAQVWPSIRFTLGAMVQIAPFLLLAVAVAAYAKASGAQRLITRAFSGRPGVTVVTGALVGALSPFCSCGVIPLVAAMLRSGVPLAPVMAFWLASPIMDPEMFILTAAGISVEFAVAKTLATVMVGLLGGFAVLALLPTGFLDAPLKGGVGGECGSGLSTGPVVWRFWSDPERRQAFGDQAASNGWFLGKWLVLAFVLESLMVAYIAPEWVAQGLGNDHWYAIPMAAGVGVPAYLNGYAAIPLVAGLLDMGMSQGAGLAFMTAGAVSSIPAAIAVYALVRRRVFALYLALGLAGALISGLLGAMFL